MTEPTSAGSVNKKFVKENFVEEGTIAGTGFSADLELQIEEYGHPELKPGIEKLVSEGTVKVPDNVEKQVREYKIRVLKEDIEVMERLINIKSEKDIRDWMRIRLEDLKSQLKNEQQQLDILNNKINEER